MVFAQRRCMPRGHASIDPRRTAKGSFTGRGQSIEQGYALGFTEFQGGFLPPHFWAAGGITVATETCRNPSAGFLSRRRFDLTDAAALAVVFSHGVLQCANLYS